MGKIFISYRRHDTAAIARHIAAECVSRYGEESVFIDIDSIRVGDNWGAIIESALIAADLIFVIIGPSWLRSHDEHGRRRIDDKLDWVRNEITYGLLNNKTIVPILVQSTNIPKKEALPDELHKILDIQFYELSDSNFDRDIQDLFIKIELSKKISCSNKYKNKLLNGSRYLDRFIIRAFMSRGGFSDVYLAWDCVKDVQVAIKILSLAGATLEIKKFIHREIFVARKIHSHIDGLVKTLEIIITDEAVHLVQEPILGDSLYNRINANSIIDEIESITTAIKICKTLEIMHSIGIFHCDIKPMNIIIVSPKNPIIVDLGTARFAGEKIEKDDIVISRPYSPNELLNGQPIDGRVDVYSVGMTLLHMLTGQETIYSDGDDSWDIFSIPYRFDVSKHPSDDQMGIYIEDKLSGVTPTHLKELIRNATAANPDKRFSNITELRFALEGFVAQPTLLAGGEVVK